MTGLACAGWQVLCLCPRFTKRVQSRKEAMGRQCHWQHLRKQAEALHQTRSRPFKVIEAPIRTHMNACPSYTALGSRPLIH